MTDDPAAATRARRRWALLGALATLALAIGLILGGSASVSAF